MPAPAHMKMKYNSDVGCGSLLARSRLYRDQRGGVRQAVDKDVEQLEASSALNAVITPTVVTAKAQAEHSDERHRVGRPRALEGIPFTIKDNFCTRDVRTTAGSNILRNFVPPYESTVTRRLWGAGAVMLGKTNMDEFGMGSSTTSSCFGPTENPVALRLGLEGIVPGGSSGGSAAAVASGACLASLGTDTGGSIRQPASFCGLVGFKPTYGLCSRWGIIAYASSLDQAGVIAKTVADAAIVMNVISGPDEMDSTSYTGDYPDYESLIGSDLRGRIIGVPKEFIERPGTADTDAVWSTLERIAHAAGFRIKSVSIPSISYALQAYYVIALCEASSNLARYDGVRYGFRAEGVENITDLYEMTRAEGFGSEVRSRVMLGTFCLSAGHYDQYYQRACKVRRVIRQQFAEALSGVDVLAWPTSPTSAFSRHDHASDPVSMYLQDVFTVPVNLAGLPAISIPVGSCVRGLPLGLTICGEQFEDATVLAVADRLASEVGFEV